MDTAAQLTRAPSGTQWTISSAGHTATVVEVGGGVRAYSVDGTDVLYGFDEHEMSPGGAGQILAPWPNRIRDGHYTFRDEAQKLSLTEPDRHNAIHGLVHWSRWRAVETQDDRVTLELDLVPQPGYPWPLRLRVTWSVSERGLRAEHEVTNTGAAAVPFGMAVHPYLIIPGVPVDELTLTVPAQNRLLVDGRLLPIGAARVAGTEFDYTEGRRLGPTVLDTAFGDLRPDDDGGTHVTVAAPDGRAVTLWADAGYRWWQVYTSDTLPPARFRKAVAVEPMTCPPDAFRSGRDLIVLEPGQTWQGTWTLRPGV